MATRTARSRVFPSLKHSSPTRRAAAHPSQSRRRRARWWGLGLILVLVASFVLIEMNTDFDWKEIPDAMNALPALAVLPLTAVLPLIGFPISIVYLALGARFGPYWGLACVAGISTVHVVGTYWIAHSFLRRPVERWLARHHQAVPALDRTDEASVVAVAVLAPVLPYFIRNYGLALAGVRLRTYLLVAVPLYTLRSAVTLFLGGLSSDPSVRGAVILGAIYVAKLSACAALVWHLRRKHRRKPAPA